MMKFVIEGSILENLLGYLVTRPFREVNTLIAEIQQNITPYAESKPAQDNAEKKTDVDDQHQT